MLKSILTSIILLTATLGYAQEGATWLTDFEAAKKVAKEENKQILMSFSGSDWCANCMRLHKTLFESEEFAAFAKDNLVLLQLDFPAKKKNKLPADQTKHNEELAEKYNKSGAFPTVLVIDAQGSVLGKLEYPQRAPADYINELKSIQGIK